MLLHFVQSLCCSLALLCRFDPPSLRSVAFMVPSNWKMCWYPHTNKLLQKCVIFNEAINLYSRGSTEQHFYVWEPRCGCLRKVKKCAGTPSLKRGNGAINMHSRGQHCHKNGNCSGTPMLSNCSIILKNVLVLPCYQIT